jgi:hypothetical protein
MLDISGSMIIDLKKYISPKHVSILKIELSK